MKMREKVFAKANDDVRVKGKELFLYCQGLLEMLFVIRFFIIFHSRKFFSRKSLHVKEKIPIGKIVKIY